MIDRELDDLRLADLKRLGAASYIISQWLEPRSLGFPSRSTERRIIRRLAREWLDEFRVAHPGEL